MPINSLEFAERFTGELDKKFVQKAVTGFFLDNAMRANFVGAKTVLIPDVDFQGLADYDRDTGFTRGAITVANTPYTMAMDRGRSMQIDREDLDETGVTDLAGKVMGEYVRKKVVPECDAYVISKLAGLAASKGNTISGNIAYPYKGLTDLITGVREIVGFDEELVAFVSINMYSQICNSPEISKWIQVSDFKQGDVSMKVKSVNGVSLIPVVPERMKTAYTFHASGEGGFTPTDAARDVFMLVLPKSGAHLVKKSERIRIFTPDKNLDAIAYRFDYRIYYDVFVKKSGLDAVWAWIAPPITISAQPSDATVTEGSISGSLSVTASGAGSLTYEWYSCNANGGDTYKVAGATTNSMTIPTTLEAGVYYYYCKITQDGIASKKTKVVKVTVEAGS